MGEVYVGDTGTKLKFDISIDISNVSVAKIYYKKPDGTTGNWDAETESPTYVTYTTQENDLDMAGIWTFQVYVELVSGWKGRSETVLLEVYEVI